MLYLIQVSDSETNLRLLKIGYSNNWPHRKSQYMLANPLTKFLEEREGDEVLERLFHLKYNKYLYPDYGNEWFLYNSEITEEFSKLEKDDLLDFLWNNRGDLLNNTYFDKTNIVKYEIIERLYTGRELDWRNKYDNLWDKKLRKEIRIDDNSLICGFIANFDKVSFFHEKMKLYCDFLDQYYDLLRTTDVYGVPREFQNYVNLLGTKRIKALGYIKKNLENEFQIIISSGNLKTLISTQFFVGSKLLLRDIKERLQYLYDNLDIKKTAKATDIEEYFEIKDIRIKMEDGRQSKGYELLKIKY